MNTRAESKVIRVIGSDECVSLNDILNNLKVLDSEVGEYYMKYFLTRENNYLPWPAPYEIGKQLDGQESYCYSYVSVDDDKYPEDTKELRVYRTEFD